MADLGRVDEEVHGRVAVHDREGEGQGRVGDVTAAYVEEPRDRVRRREHHRVDGVPGEELGDLAPLVGRGPPGVLQIVGDDGTARGRRLIVPDPVDEVLGERDERGARLGARGLEALHALDRVKPGIVAETVALAEAQAEPLGGRALRHVVVLEHVTGSLVSHLERVAPIDEDGRGIGQDGGQPGRAGEATDPGQALRSRRNVLALVLVGPRDQEPRESLLGELLAESLDPLVDCHGRRAHQPPAPRSGAVVARSRVGAPVVTASATLRPRGDPLSAGIALTL